MRANTNHFRIWIHGGFPFISLVTWVVSFPICAQDSVDTVLERMKSTTATRIDYHETRYLELLEKPVEASGKFYAMPPDLLIREQLEPTSEIMGVRKNRYYYFSPDRGIHHSQEADSEDPINVQFAAFQALVNGNQRLMETLYQVSFVSDPGRWYMVLSDRMGSEALVRITVSGFPGQSADKIEIHQADGDRSVFRLRKDGEGEGVQAAILRLEAKLTDQ